MNGKLKGLAAIVAATIIATSCGSKQEDAKAQYASCSPIATVTAEDIPPNFANLEQRTLSDAERNTLLEQIESGALESQFGKLSRESQEKLLAHLEKYSLDSTYLGKVARDVGQAANRMGARYALNQTLGKKGNLGGFEFDSFTKDISYFNPSPERSFRQYLHGRSIPFGKAHEQLHLAQNRSSPWYEFEKFLSKNIRINEKGENIFELTPELESEFARQFLKKPEATDQETTEALNKMIKDYRRASDVRQLIMEVQAYITFEPYTSPEHLRSDMGKARRYDGLIAAVTEQEFSAIANATLQLLGTMNPVKAAEIAGRHGESIQGYIGAADSMAKCLGYTPSQALQKGIERQDAALVSISNITGEAARQLQKAN